MRGVVGHVTSSSFWWGVATVVVALVIWRNYGNRLGVRLPYGQRSNG